MEEPCAGSFAPVPLGAVEFRVLGPLEVEHDSGLVPLGGPKERAALAVLVLGAGQVVSAESLIDAVWGENPPRTAGKTLQTYIFRLRRSLAGAGEVLVTRGAGYCLDASGEQVDAVCFERLIADCRRATTVSHPEVALTSLNRALALWRGQPMAELSFSAVIAAESTRLCELRLAALERRFELELAAGRHQEMVGELHHLISEHPMREGLWASLMLALYRCGRQSDALRAYQGARAVLVDELGVEPGPGLQELERRILAHDPELGADRLPPPGTGVEAIEIVQPPLPAALARVAATPVVGRTSEKEQLATAWGAARSGARRAVLIAGEPGIGKTTLAAAVACEVHAAGGLVLYGRCDEDAVIAYQPIVEALTAFVTAAPVALLHSHLAETGGELGRLLPELRRRIPGLEIPPRAGAADAAERHMLFDAAASLLATAARRLPLLLVLDDLHWADQATLLLIRHLLRATDPGSLLVVGTYRDTEIGRRHPLAEALAQMRRDQSIERLCLVGLDSDGVMAIVAEVLGDDDGGQAELASRIAYETAGNPLFVREVVRHLAESGPGGGGEEISVPEGVHEVIGRRAARLSDDANDSLAVAAVIGRQFEVDVVAEVAQLGEVRAVSALEEAGRAGLILEVGSSGERYEFAHALVRRSLYGELSASRRVRTHRRVAAVLERIEARRPGSRVGEIAYHLAEAAQRDDVERAVSYCRAAGDAALAQLAYEEAARHYRRGLDMLDLDESASDETRAELLLALGDAVSRVDLPPALEVLEEAAGVARRAGSVPLLARAALAMVGARVAAAGPGPEAALLDEALAAVPDDDPLTVQLLSAKAQWLSIVAPLEVLSPLSRRAMGLARRIGDPSLVLAAAVGRLFSLADAADSEERLALSNEILRGGEQCEPRVLVIAHRNRAHALFERQSHGAAWESVEEHRWLAERLRHPVSGGIVALIDAMRAYMEGSFGDAEVCLGRARELGNRALGSPWGDFVPLPALFVIRWLQERLPDLDDVTEHGLRVLPSATVARTGHAVVLAASGRSSKARALLAEGVAGPVASIPRDRTWSAVLFHLVIVQQWAPDPERAGELYALLHPYEDRDWVPMGRWFQGCFAHHLGVLAAVAGDLDLAVSHLDDACERYRKIGAPPWCARAEQALAEVLTRRNRPGDRHAAGALLATAAATASRLGMTPSTGF